MPGYLKMGWQVAAQWPLYLKPLRPLRMAWRRLRPLPAAGAEAFDQHCGLRTVRTPDYLAWRDGGHPHIAYGLYPHTDSQGRLQGLAIVRPNRRYGWQEAVLTELFLAQPALAGGVALLRGRCRHLHSDDLIAHAARPTLEYAILRRSGCWPAPRQQITFTVRPLHAGAAALRQAAAWDLTLGDLELF